MPSSTHGGSPRLWGEARIVIAAAAPTAPPRAPNTMENGMVSRIWVTNGVTPRDR